MLGPLEGDLVTEGLVHACKYCRQTVFIKSLFCGCWLCAVCSQTVHKEVFGFHFFPWKWKSRYSASAGVFFNMFSVWCATAEANTQRILTNGNSLSVLKACLPSLPVLCAISN